MLNLLINYLALCGLLWCFICCLDSHSDGTHSLLRSLVSKWCNAKFLQIYSEDETSSSASWMSVTKFSAKQFFLEESDMTYNQVWWPIIRNCALHLTHPRSTHTQQTHPEQWAAIYAGSSWGFGALLKAQLCIECVESAVHSLPHLHTCQPEIRTRNLSITSPTL